MSDSFQFLLTSLSCGVGFGLLGAVNALGRRSSLAIRSSVSLAIIGLLSGVAFAAAGSVPAQRVALILIGVYATLVLAGSSWLANGMSWTLSTFRTPSVRWGALGLFGIASTLGAIVHSDIAQSEADDREMVELESLSTKPVCVTPAVRVTTDAGREVGVEEATAPRELAELAFLDEMIFSRPLIRDSVIRSQPASDRTNCHGWIFTGGRFWVAGSEVDRILSDNGYSTVNDPRPGDLVIYRSVDSVTHTGIVRYVSDNQPVLVEGKWGCSGVYLHPVDKSIYGARFSYYRSHRNGHILAGLNSVVPLSPQGSPLVVPNPSNPDEFTE